MRKWIDLVAEEEELDEGKFSKKVGQYAASVALAGAAIQGMGGKAKGTEPTELPSYYVYDDEAKELGLTDLDSVENTTNSKNRAAKKPVANSKNRAAKKPVENDRSPIVAMTESESVNLLALTMWGEARSDGVQAMRAVGHVIMNRISSKRHFGRNIKEVVWKRKAFSCWNPSDPNRERMREIAKLPEDSLDRVRWNQALKLAHIILSGDRDITSGALFYHTKQIKPFWVGNENKPIAQVSNHLFYNSDAKAKS